MNEDHQQSQGTGQAYEGPGSGPHREHDHIYNEDQNHRRGHWSGHGELRGKSTFLGGFLSGLIPGMGQVYAGYYQRGFIYVLIFSAVITGLAGGSLIGLEPLAGIFLGFFWLYNIIDGARCVVHYNLIAAGSDPDLTRMPLPGAGGGQVSGILLVVFGLFLLLRTRFDVSMEWLEEWWPIGFVILGIYLIYQHRQSRAD